MRNAANSEALISINKSPQPIRKLVVIPQLELSRSFSLKQEPQHKPLKNIEKRAYYRGLNYPGLAKPPGGTRENYEASHTSRGTLRKAPTDRLTLCQTSSTGYRPRSLIARSSSIGNIRSASAFTRASKGSLTLYSGALFTKRMRHTTPLAVRR